MGYKVMLVILLFVQACAMAQTTEEWLQQKETKRKYLLEQIAALHVYIDYAKKGYGIAEAGLKTIHSIRRGDFKLHSDFIASLGSLNPSLAKWSLVADIIALQTRIVLSSRQIAESLSQDDKEFSTAVMSSVVKESLQLIDELLRLTASGTYEMKDDERLVRLEDIYREVQDEWSFLRDFSDWARGSTPGNK